jgi:hypothetical protein
MFRTTSAVAWIFHSCSQSCAHERAMFIELVDVWDVKNWKLGYQKSVSSLPSLPLTALRSEHGKGRMLFFAFISRLLWHYWACPCGCGAAGVPMCWKHLSRIGRGGGGPACQRVTREACKSRGTTGGGSGRSQRRGIQQRLGHTRQRGGSAQDSSSAHRRLSLLSDGIRLLGGRSRATVLSMPCIKCALRCR